MNYTKQELEKMMEENGGSLYLRGTQITSLPENLTVGGWLDLSGTQITSLPENLTVGGSLDLSGTQITSLPENLTVGGSLYLRGTQITNRNCRHLKDGDYKEGNYLFCDGILTHIKVRKTMGQYTYYVGKIKGKNVVCDGEYYAHCRTFKEGVLDIAFKKSEDRGAEQYSHLMLESELTYNEAVIAYRVITGACRAGTQQFLDSIKEKKEKYTVAEIIEITKGQFGSTVFENFFKKIKE